MISEIINYRKLFTDKEVEYNFTENGYAIIKDVISEDTIKILSSYFDKLMVDINLKEGFSTPFDYFDLAKRLETHHFICNELNNTIDSTCIDCEVYLANYLIKTPENKFKIDIHQDWSYVDETKHRSFNIWIPLTDTTINNGAMVIIPKTQFKNIPTYRTPSIPFYFDRYKEQLYDYLQPVELKKGDCVIFDNSTIHGATSNNSLRNRIAVVLCVKPKETKLQFFFPEKEKILVFEQDNDYVFHFDDYLIEIKEKPPTGKLTDSFPVNSIKKISIDDIRIQFKGLNIRMHKVFEAHNKKNIFLHLLRKCIQKIKVFSVF